MAIDETRLENAVIKVAARISLLKEQLKESEQMLSAIKTSRRIRIEDITTTPPTVTFDLPIDPDTQEKVSRERRQEIFDNLIPKIDALR